MQLVRILVVLALLPPGCAPQMRSGGAETRLRPAFSTPVSKTLPDKPLLARVKKGRYRVMAPWTVELGGTLWHVQKGYTCNGITAPQRIRKSLGDGVDQQETWAAVFHDWLYTRPGMTRDRADRLFYELLLAYGLQPVKARLMYAGVSAYSASKVVRQPSSSCP